MPSGENGPNLGVVSGTRVCTARGDVPVEDLRIGDAVVVACGELHPFRSIRKRTVECWRQSDVVEASPVRIARHAFGPHKPTRDLLVAFDQPICVTCVEDVLVPACALVNGSTVAHIESDAVTYWLLELDGGETFLAEDMAIGAVVPDGGLAGVSDPPAVAARPARSVQSGPVLDAIREQMRLRADALGWEPCRDVTISCLADGQRLDPVLADNHAFFTFYDGGAHLKIQTTMTVPAQIGGFDLRRLGIAVYGLAVVGADGETRTLSLDDPEVQSCFHESDPGQGHRWTKDDLLIPLHLYDGLRSPLMLRLTYEPGTIRGWTAPEPAAAPIERQLRVVA